MVLSIWIGYRINWIISEVQASKFFFFIFLASKELLAPLRSKIGTCSVFCHSFSVSPGVWSLPLWHQVCKPFFSDPQSIPEKVETRPKTESKISWISFVNRKRVYITKFMSAGMHEDIRTNSHHVFRILKGEVEFSSYYTLYAELVILIW